jgi:ribosome maturation factor RimP
VVGVVSEGLEQRLQEIIEPVVRSEGMVLVELIWRRESSGRVLRLFVERPDQGVNLEDCSQLSRLLGDLLDVEDLIPEPYNLEVSSPGLTRKLKSPAEYDIFAGRQARLVISDDQGKSTSLIGRLQGLMGGDVVLEVEGKPRAVPLARVVKARLELET